MKTAKHAARATASKTAHPIIDARTGKPVTRAEIEHPTVDGKPVETKPEFIALVSLGGGGSWFRGPDKDEAIRKAVRIAKQDWSRLFNFKKGSVIKVNLFDVTGRGDLLVGDNGVIDTSSGKDEYVPRLDLVSVML